jgi:hypothetical protein
MESSNAHVVPRQIDDNLVVDVMSDNRGRGDVGDINFRLQVPANSSVDLETRRGQISVLNLRGSSVRAHVSTEGDIELTNITASQVVAQNRWQYLLRWRVFVAALTNSNRQRDITIRIPGSAFRLVAASPRNVSRSAISGTMVSRHRTEENMLVMSDGRSSVSVTNFSGQITFLRK